MAQKIHNIDGNDSRASFSDKEKFALDVLVGLTKTPKAIAAIYHYDAEGSRLFDKITKLPEYYLTSCEIETLDRNKNRISENMNSEAFNLVEFGPGNGSKTKIIIDHLLNKKIDFQYIPIDISHSAIEMLMEDYKSCYPDLEINAVVADYFDGVKWLNRRSNRRNVVLFLGSNIGNFNFSDTRLFLRNLWITLNNKDIVLIGFDLKKDIELLLHAYNDLSGVTAEFSLNLLRRINNELGGNFNLEKFRHFATYEVASGAMESYLVSLVNQDVTVKEITRSFHFDSWEPIHVEYSYKYHISDIENLAVETGYKVVEHMYDKRKYFTDSLWQVIKE